LYPNPTIFLFTLTYNVFSGSLNPTQSISQSIYADHAIDKQISSADISSAD